MDVYCSKRVDWHYGLLKSWKYMLHVLIYWFIHTREAWKKSGIEVPSSVVLENRSSTRQTCDGKFEKKKPCPESKNFAIHIAKTVMKWSLEKLALQRDGWLPKTFKKGPVNGRQLWECTSSYTIQHLIRTDSFKVIKQKFGSFALRRHWWGACSTNTVSIWIWKMRIKYMENIFHVKGI